MEKKTMNKKKIKQNEKEDEEKNKKKERRRKKARAPILCGKQTTELSIRSQSISEAITRQATGD